ncbi:GAK system XXXCH domain-containing protein [Megalodesulfovibrio paquesii]
MQFKALKQEMEACFARIKTSASNGELPGKDDINVFVRYTQKMQAIAADEWMEECLDFVHMVEQLAHAVKKNQVTDAIMLVDSLDETRNNCHLLFSK